MDTAADMRKVYQLMEVGGLPSQTLKLRVGTEVDGYDLYIVLAWYGGRFVYVDVTLSIFAYNEMNKHRRVESLLVANLRREQVAHARAAIEIITRQATELLASSTWTMDDVIAAWAGTHIFNGGECQTLPSVAGQMQRATGALDAVARLLRHRLPAITNHMRTEVSLGRQVAGIQ